MRMMRHTQTPSDARCGYRWKPSRSDQGFPPDTAPDTRIDIGKSVLNRIFEPYFTTKGKTRRTGFGLSVVHVIVNAGGRNIRMDSTQDRDTTPYIHLTAGDPESPEAGNTDNRPRSQKNTKQILIVDDETAVVRVMRIMLERLGYRVTSRTDSTEALKVFAETPDAFDLVITDMTMPNMTGDQLSRKIIKIRPDIPIIINTGYSNLIDAEKAEKIGIKGFLTKPVVKRTLATAVRQAIAQRKRTKPIESKPSDPNLATPSKSDSAADHDA